MRSKCPTDIELLAAWRAGDRRAGDLLFERHYPSIRRFLSNRAGPDCEDLIQATFLGCVEGIGRFRGDSSFRTLLFAIAWNKLRGHIHAKGRALAPLDPAADLPASAPTFGTLLVAVQERALVREAMLRLPEDTRAMLELYYWEAMPVKEIASVLERPLGTVKTRMKRGREQLVREFDALRGAEARYGTHGRVLENTRVENHDELDIDSRYPHQ
jgi:RNA polymerase sigma factor (sigma-70 family)